MKILLTNFHPGNGGGHTTYIQYLFKEFNKKPDLEVYIACPKSSKLYRLCSEINKDNTFAIDFPSKIKELGAIYKNTKKLVDIIRKYNFDILHVNGNPEHKMVMYSKIFYNFNFRIIRTKHESKAIKDNFFTKLQYDKFMGKMIVVSNHQLQEIDKQFIKDKTVVIHNGVDTEYFKPQKKNLELMNKYNIKNDYIVFVSVAGTALHKGWQYLVEAVSQLDDKLKSRIKIILAGNEPKDGILKKYVISKKMKNNVIFTGMIDDVRDVISIGDVGFVLSTSIETISFACREMMSMSKPVIVSNYAGLPENIEDGKDGWIIENKDIDSLIKVIQTINKDKSCIDNFSKQAEVKSSEKFGLNLFIEKTLEVYRGIK